MRRLRLWWLTAIVMAFAVHQNSPAQPTVIRHVVSSGAVAATSPTHSIAGTIGQTIIGRSTSSTHAASLGFWYTYPFSSTTGIDDDVATGATAVIRVAPNPVSASASIIVALPHAGSVRLSLFDNLGRERLRLLDERRETGAFTLELSARDLESGEYLVVLDLDGRRTATPLHVIK